MEAKIAEKAQGQKKMEWHYVVWIVIVIGAVLAGLDFIRSLHRTRSLTRKSDKLGQ